MVGIVLLGIFVVLLIFGAPIAVCLGMSSAGAILTQGAGKPLDAIMSVLPRLCSYDRQAHHDPVPAKRSGQL